MVTVLVRCALHECVYSHLLYKKVSGFWNPPFTSVGQTEYVCTGLSRCLQVLPLSRCLRLDCVVWIKLQAPGPSLEHTSDGKPSGILTAKVILLQSQKDSSNIHAVQVVFPLDDLLLHPLSLSLTDTTFQVTSGEENTTAIKIVTRTSTSWKVTSQASCHPEPHPSCQQLNCAPRR